jgi:hypothetical protein
VPQVSGGAALEELGVAEEEDGTTADEEDRATVAEEEDKTIVDEEDIATVDDEEDGTTAVDEEDGTTAADEEDGTTTADEDDGVGDNVCRKVIFCTRVLPLPVSGTNAYDVSKCPSAETVIIQFPGSAFSISEPEEIFSFANATSIFIPPPLCVRRVVKMLPPTPLTDST